MSTLPRSLPLEPRAALAGVTCRSRPTREIVQRHRPIHAIWGTTLK